MLSLDDPIRVKIDGIEFRGIGCWSDEEGFSAELDGKLSNITSRNIEKLRNPLPITINESERGLLLKPYLTKVGGLKFVSGSPITTQIELHAKGIIRKLPWKFRVSSKVSQIKLTSNALNLWYGEQKDVITYNSKERSISAYLKSVEDSYDTGFGDLMIGLSISGPKMPAMGNYKLSSQPFAKFVTSNLLSMIKAFDMAYALEGFFELLAGFPKRQFEFEVKFDDFPDQFVPLGIAAGLQRKKSQDYPMARFLGRQNMINLGFLFAEYKEIHKNIAIMQTAVRYLSGDSIVLPEGFLTACNVIESIGKNAPNSNDYLKPLLKDVYKALKRSNKSLACRFNFDVRPKIYVHSSFKDRFEHIKDILAEVGVPVAMQHIELSKARAAYRHDIIALKQGDINTMQAGIGLAWFLGLIWLCREVGVPDSVLFQAASQDHFHDMRGTYRSLWAK